MALWCRFLCLSMFPHSLPQAAGTRSICSAALWPGIAPPVSCPIQESTPPRHSSHLSHQGPVYLRGRLRGGDGCTELLGPADGLSHRAPGASRRSISREATGGLGLGRDRGNGASGASKLKDWKECKMCIQYVYWKNEYIHMTTGQGNGKLYTGKLDGKKQYFICRCERH